MAETDDSGAAATTEDERPEPEDEVSPSEESHADESQAEESEADEASVSELVEQLGRDATTLGFYEAQLAASRRIPQVRETLLGVMAVVAMAVAFGVAFALVNWAAVRGLSTVLPDWAAPLVLATAWTVIGCLLLLILRRRTRGFAEWRWIPALMGGPVEPLREDLEQERDNAQEALGDTLERLSGAIASQAASAIVPDAGEMADGVVAIGDDLIEGSDDIVEAIADEVPGGSVVNHVWDVVLIPGRFGVRVATTVLKRGSPGT